MTQSGNHQEQDRSQHPTDATQLHEVRYWQEQDQAAYERWAEATGTPLVETQDPNIAEFMPVVQLTDDSFVRVLPHLQFERQRRQAMGDSS